MALIFFSFDIIGHNTNSSLIRCKNQYDKLSIFIDTIEEKIC